MPDYLEVRVNINANEEGLQFIWQTDLGVAESRVSADQEREWSAALTRAETSSGLAAAKFEFQTLGVSVFRAVFQDAVKQLWNTTLSKYARDGLVRITFAYNASSAMRIARVPFEAMSCPPADQGRVGRVVGDLVTNSGISIARKVYGAPDLEQRHLNVDPPLRVLVIASRPRDLPAGAHLPTLDQELATLTAELDRLGSFVRYESIPPGSASFAELRKRGPNFHVVHFIGHGERAATEQDAVLLFENADGTTDRRTGAELSTHLLAGDTRLLVLNGCGTAASGVLACRFPAVIGMLANVLDQTAASFAAGFYESLTDSAQLDMAMTKGRERIDEAPQSVRWERVKPALYMHSTSGVLAHIRPTLVSPTLPQGRVGIPYRGALTSRGGRRPHRYQLSSQPPGLTIDSNTGDIFGVPMASGQFTLRITITSRDGQATEICLPLQVLDGRDPGLYIITEEVASGIEGNHVDQVLEARGGIPPLAWHFGVNAHLRCCEWGAVNGFRPVAAAATVLHVSVVDSAGNRAERVIPVRSESFPPVPIGFVRIPAGPFALGYHPSQGRDASLNWLGGQGYPISAESARARWPAAVVHLDAYCMQALPTTNAEYMMFVHESGRTNPMAAVGPHAQSLMQNPVVNVSHADAVAFCDWKTQKAIAAGQPWQFRLPNNWEWEKAARGAWSAGDHAAGRVFPWGDLWGTGNSHCRSAGALGTAPVALRGASPFGAGDLVGNVAEWIDGGQIKDGEAFHHVRGGDWRDVGQFEGLCFTSDRVLAPKGYSGDDIGFRCVAVPNVVPPAQSLVPLGNDVFTDSDGIKQHIGRFLLARFAVSNAEYREFKPNHPSKPHELHWPVQYVSYQDALDFCAWKSQRDGRRFSLPSDAHWQRASLGTDRRAFPWLSAAGGNGQPPSLRLPEPLDYAVGENGYSRYLCNSLESGFGRPVDVFSMWAGTSPEGVYHLCGNVFEWLSNRRAVGGSWLSSCERYGTWPYIDGDDDQQCAAQAGIGFRYMTL